MKFIFSFFEKYYSPILDILIAHLTAWLDQPINSYGLIKVKREYTEYIDLVICFSQERVSYFSKYMLLPFKIFEDCYEAFHFTYFDKWWNTALLIASLYIGFSYYIRFEISYIKLLIAYPRVTFLAFTK